MDELERFKELSFKVLGLVSSPTVEDAWIKAYEKAYQFGLSEVFFHFKDRIAILKGEDDVLS